MYAYICANAHLSHSESKDPIGGCPSCSEGAYRVVAASEAHAAGVHPHDCTRTVRHPNGAALELHLRTGLAYGHRELSSFARTDRAIKLSSRSHLSVVR